MFDALQSRLAGVFDTLKGRGALSSSDVDAALREVRVALLEADVALSVVKDFIEKVRIRAVGEEVVRSIAPGQQVVKIVHDAMVEMLGPESAALSLGAPPAPILMIGLQGSGKTTSSAKLARLLQTREKKRVLMASLDVRRPAAMEQLKVLGKEKGYGIIIADVRDALIEDNIGDMLQWYRGAFSDTPTLKGPLKEFLKECSDITGHDLPSK